MRPSIVMIFVYAGILIAWVFWPQKKCPRCRKRENLSFDASRLRCCKCGCVFFKVDP